MEAQPCFVAARTVGVELGGGSMNGAGLLRCMRRAAASRSALAPRRWIVSASVANSTKREPGTQPIDWKSLLFSYVPTRCHVQYTYKDGAWSAASLEAEPFMRVHIGATALHYGQSCFEGLKAFHCQDGRVRIFRADENSKRMTRSSTRLCMPEVPEQLFIDAVHTVVRENIDYVPPYGSGGSLYIRPLLFGSGPKIGLAPADEYTFLVVVMPVGDYYKGGLSPVTAFVSEGYDRAAPLGVGNAKVGANYAADILPNQLSKKQGYPINLYLDPLHHRYIEEFGTSNFVGIKGSEYLTPDSPSILASITNKSLMQLAPTMGLEVVRRKIDIAEVKEMDEVAACGTAVVITPVSRVVYGDELIKVGQDADAVGPTSAKLYAKVRAIQMAEEDDPFNWTQVVE
ncbi:Branched-chain-amino-acid aminotransferase [Porphyridium purpureum]|uniref:Branched-chain-amino-acid aminotransferase n=1 Tax=Porphyridium purpureum TaxID=35688 RepID=A0A5J4YI86_PORPP|nr:Branched-chain-amino-acid aminotransferase [Porphyridium purpureum]|eukprot:POR8438..scf251_18